MQPDGRRCRRPGASTGFSTSQTPSLAMGQRGWNLQPVGGSSGLGTSPLRIVRRRLRVGSGIGIAESSASVYGWVGLL